ncbi:MAG: hypothetical protein IPL79_14205 [Myxococcales bacterium]|nr:hypothetical protein [Myxococcales bacterium]
MSDDLPQRSAQPLDPELIALSRPRPTITMITAAAVVLVAVVLLWRTNADRKFVWRAGEVTTITARGAGAAHVESMVKLPEATLDYGSALRIRTGKHDRGIRLAPVGGSNLSLWVAADGHAWSAPNVAEADRPAAQAVAYQGRLRRIADTKFADQLTAYMKQPQPVAFAAADLRAALASGASSIISVTGDAIAMPPPATKLEFEVANPGAVQLQCVFVAKHVDVAAWRQKLQTVLGVDVGAPVAETPYVATFRLDALPPALPTPAAVTQALAAAGLAWTVEVSPAMVRHVATLAEVAAANDVVRISDNVALAWRDIDVVALWLPRAVPSDARVILVHDDGSTYWYITPLVIALVILLGLFIWAFVRAWRYEAQEARAQQLLRDLQRNSVA